MKVLQVVPGMSAMFGGPSVAIADLTKALVRRGHDATIFTTDATPAGRLDVPLGRPVNQSGAPVVYFGAWPGGRYSFSWPLAQALRRTIRSYDVAHVHWLYNFSSLAAALAARSAGVPYLLQLNGSADPHLMKKNEIVKRIYLSVAGRFIIDNAAGVIFTTDMERRQVALRRLRVPSHVVPVGLDWHQYAELPAKGDLRRRFPEIGDRRVVLFLGRLSRQKGLDLLIPAFDAVHAQRPDTHLVIAGPDGDGYGAHVRQWVADRRLQDRVTFAGRVPDELKLATYVDADVYVLPSYAENFGATVAEALACERPVVITNRVNLCDEITAADAGLVTDCSADAVARGIVRLLEDAPLSSRLARNGRDLVRRKLTWDTALETLLPLYQQLAAQTPRAGRAIADEGHG